MLIVDERIAIPLDEFEFQFARAGGPGGQNVNTVASKATLRWRPAQSGSLPAPVRERFVAKYAGRLTSAGELLITSQRTRDRERNVADCLDRLRSLVLAVASPPKVRRPSRPTRASKLRREAMKARRSETKRGRRGVELD
jgi:ribosome-associated protein